MKQKEMIRLLRQARVKVAKLNEKRDRIYDRLTKKLGTEDEHSCIFDYVYNGSPCDKPEREIVREIKGVTLQ